MEVKLSSFLPGVHCLFADLVTLLEPWGVKEAAFSSSEPEVVGAKVTRGFLALPPIRRAFRLNPRTGGMAAPDSSATATPSVPGSTTTVAVVAISTEASMTSIQLLVLAAVLLSVRLTAARLSQTDILPSDCCVSAEERLSA
jgi:hypothetical protein